MPTRIIKECKAKNADVEIENKFLLKMFHSLTNFPSLGKHFSGRPVRNITAAIISGCLKKNLVEFTCTVPWLTMHRGRGMLSEHGGSHLEKYVWTGPWLCLKWQVKLMFYGDNTDERTYVYKSAKSITAEILP